MAAAIAVYYLGVWLRYKIGFLRKYCIPAPIVGGASYLPLSIACCMSRESGRMNRIRRCKTYA
nr:sodium/glutamate symporter [Megasphaera vaginalis (ex Srinivasan et al. 2021)]